MGHKGGSASTPRMLDDNLRSKQFYRVLDLLSEGEIYGPVDTQHLSSFHLNKSPVTDDQGNINIHGISATWRPGTVDQDPINGMNTIEATTMVNAQVKQPTPLVRTITDPHVTQVRFNIGVSGLVSTDKKGNQDNTSVNLALEGRTGTGTWQMLQNVTISGKISGEYLEAHVCDIPATRPFDIRVRRVTADSTVDTLQNDTTWNSYVEITPDKLSYPWSALAACVIDRDQYTDAPTRNYHLRGLIVPVPDNYDPATRTYAGLWKGTFKQAWTDNPAWLFREVAKNKRFGLARVAGDIDVDDGALYILSQYCDQLVDDGYGGKEPRLRLNAYITEQITARELLDKIASMFRGIALWDGQRLTVMVDLPADPIAVVTNANVVDGKFKYSSTKRSERYNAVIVSWTDPSNGWEQSKEYVSDDAMIQRYGYRETTLEAFGTTSRGQAYRAGRWLLETAKLETKKVAFSMAREAIAFTPGDIVLVMDSRYAGARLGGRVTDASANRVHLDKAAPSNVKLQDKFIIAGANGKPQTLTITGIDADRLSLTLDSNLTRAAKNTPYLISSTDVAPRQFRIVSISEDENNTSYNIEALAHEPQKQAIVDNGAVFKASSDSLNGFRVPGIENLTVAVENSETVQLTASWQTLTTTRNLHFDVVVYTPDGQKVITRGSTDQFEYKINGLITGAYKLGVRGVNSLGMKGAETVIDFAIGAPAAPTSVEWKGGIFTATLVPVTNYIPTTDMTFEYWGGDTTRLTDINTVTDKAQFLGRGHQWTLTGLNPSQTYYVYVRAKNAWGYSAFIEASGEAADDIPGMIDYIDKKIKQTPTYTALNADIVDINRDVTTTKVDVKTAKDTADKAAKDLADQAKVVTAQGTSLAAVVQKAADNATHIADEVTNRTTAIKNTADKAASDLQKAAAKAVTDDAAVAAKAAQSILDAKTAVQANIDNLSKTTQDQFTSMAEQMASLSAGTGEQFDAKQIWYFDKTAEGWTVDDAGATALTVTADGWLQLNGATGLAISPNSTDIDATSYKYIRLRIRKKGAPHWGGKVSWIGKSETGWTAARSVTIPEPAWDTDGVSAVSIHDIAWQGSADIRRIKLELATGATAANTYEIDWLAVGRPTPGASQAQIQTLQKAITDGDHTEATQRNTLATQLRGDATDDDPGKLTSGLIFNEQQARIKAESAISSKVDTLRNDYDKSTAAATQRMDTLASADEATSKHLTQLDGSLSTAKDTLTAQGKTLTQLQTTVTNQGGTLTTQGQSITSLTGRLDGLQIGGTNLIPNSGTGRLPGASDGGQFMGCQVSSYTTQANATGYTQAEIILNAPVNATEYALSFWAKGSANLQLAFYFYNPASTTHAVNSQGVTGSWANGGDGQTYLNITTEWRQYWVKWTQTPGTAQKHLIIGRMQAGAQARTFSICRPQFEVGNVVTDWKPAPTDSATAAALTGLTTRVSTAEGKLTTQGQQTTSLTNMITAGNMILNGDFTAGITNWAVSGTGTQDLEWVSAESAIATTDATLRMANTTAMHVEPGETVRVTFDVKATDAGFAPGAQALVGVISSLANATSWVTSTDGWVQGMTTSFQTKTVTLQIPETFTGSVVYLRFALAGFTPTTARLHFRNVLVTSSLGIAGKASSSAVTNLENRVTKTEQSISTNAQSITSLSGKIDTTNNNLALKADASSLDQLSAKVTQNGQDISSAGDRITELKNSLDSQSIGGSNLLLDTDLSDAPVAIQSPTTSFRTRDFKPLPDMPNTAVTHDTAFTLTLWYQEYAPNFGTSKPFSSAVLGSANTSGDSWSLRFYASQGKIRQDASLWVWTGTITAHAGATLLVNPQALRFLFEDSTQKTGCKIYKVQLERGSRATDWKPANLDLQNPIKANATAISSLQQSVTQHGNTITSQGTAITSVSGDLTQAKKDLQKNIDDNNAAQTGALNDAKKALQTNIDAKASNQALQTLTQKVTDNAGAITNNAQAITTVKGNISTMQGDIATKASAQSVTDLSQTVSDIDGRVTANATNLSTVTASLNTVTGNLSTTNQHVTNAQNQADNARQIANALTNKGADLILNPTLDSAMGTMGFTVVPTTGTGSTGVPTGCPFSHAIKLTVRDHHPNFACIPAVLGETFTMSALVACGQGSADFNLYLGTASSVFGSVGAPLSSGGHQAATPAGWHRVTWNFTVTQAMADRGWFRPFLQVNQSGPNFNTTWYVTDWHLINTTSRKLIDAAQTAASDAHSAATTADGKAVAAQTTASEAKTAASDAHTAATTADGKAVAAQTTATQAKTAASDAHTAATTADGKAVAAQTTATQAKTAAGAAQSTADEAKTAAANVKLTADANTKAIGGLTTRVGNTETGIEANTQSITDLGGRVTTVENGQQADARAIASLQTLTKTQGTEIDSQSSQLTNLGNKVDSMRSQSTNLVPNYDFRLGLTSWEMQNTGGVKWGATTGDGKAGVELKFTGGTNYPALFANSNILWPVQGARKYRMMVKAKQSGGTGNVLMRRWEKRADGTMPYQDHVETFPGTWTVKTFDFDLTHTDATGIVVGIYCYPAIGTIDVDFITLYDITDATLITNQASAISGLTTRVTTAEGTIHNLSTSSTSLQNSLTETRGDVDNLRTDMDATQADMDSRVQGNMLVNGGFERDLDGWTTGPGTVVATILAQTPRSGKKILKFTARAANGGQQDTIQQRTDLMVVKGHTYKLGAFIRSDGNTTMKAGTEGNNKIRLGLTGVNNPVAELSIDPAKFTTGATWTEISKTWTATDTNTAQLSVMLLLATGAVYLDDVYFIDVTDAVNIKANSDAVATLQTQVTSANGTITSQGESITHLTGSLTTAQTAIAGKASTGDLNAAKTDLQGKIDAKASTSDLNAAKTALQNSIALKADNSALNTLKQTVTDNGKQISANSDAITDLQSSVEDNTQDIAKKADATAVTQLQQQVTQHGNTLSSQGSAITQVTGNINHLLRMNMNPFLDGSFESYDTTKGEVQVGGAGAVVQKVHAHGGTQALLLTRNATETGNSDKTMGTSQTLRSGGKYRFECWVMMMTDQKPPTGWTTVIGLQMVDQNNHSAWVSGITINEATLTTGGGRGQWVKVSGVATVGTDGKTMGRLWVSNRLAHTGDTGAYQLYLDDLIIVDVTDAAAAQATADASASAVSNLQQSVKQQGDDITAQGKAITAVTSRVGATESSIKNQDETIASNALAMSDGFRQLHATVADNSATVTQLQKTVSDLSGSTATSIETVKATADGAAAAVQTASQAAADVKGRLDAQWGVKVTTDSKGNHVVGGIQLGTGDGQSQFLIQADQLAIYNPGKGGAAPFMVDNGNVYINSALIKDASIDQAKVKLARIDAGIVKGLLKSDNFDGGSHGWGLNSNGDMILNNGTFRGHVEAGSGSFTGSINATDGTFRGAVEANSFVGDIAAMNPFPAFQYVNGALKSRMNHHDTSNKGGKSYSVSGIVRWVAGNEKSTIGIEVWVNGQRVSRISFNSSDIGNSLIGYLPFHGTRTGINTQSTLVEVVITDSSSASIVAATCIMSRGSGNWENL